MTNAERQRRFRESRKAQAQTRVTVYLSPSALVALQRLAERTDWNQSQVIEACLHVIVNEPQRLDFDGV